MERLNPNIWIFVMSTFYKSYILIISPESWDAHFVSKHHYAVTLAGLGHAVYFLNPPVAIQKKISLKKTEYEGVWQVFSPIIMKGLQYYPKTIKKSLEANWLRKLENKIGSQINTVWLFENSRFFDMSFAGDRLKIYHQVDLNQNFHPDIAASTADICFCTTDIIKNKLQCFTENVFKIHHGTANFKQPLNLTRKQKCRFDNNLVNAVYVGNLNIEYLDVELLTELVRENQDILFHFVGAFMQKGALYKACSMLQNIVWWGKVDSRLILAILSECDLSLLVYRAEHAREQLASPHKMMEYLDSGRITVATYTDEYKDKRHLLEMVDSSKDYLQCFNEVVNNLSYFNSEQKQSERKCFTQDNTYACQLNRISTYLKGQGFVL